MKRDEGLSLVVLAYNEELNVPTVLPGILAWLRGLGRPYQLVLVDDGSSDRTAALAREVFGDDPRCALVSHATNRGIGAGLKSGVRAASEPWVTFLPCDGQIPVEELGKLVDEAQRSGARVVLSVYEDRRDGWHRAVLSAGVRGLIRVVHGVRMRSDGPYLFHRALFDAERLTPDTFFLNFEFPLRVLRAGERYGTVTVRCVPRVAGVSKSTGLRRVAGVARELAGLRVRLWREALGLDAPPRGLS